MEAMASAGMDGFDVPRPLLPRHETAVRSGWFRSPTAHGFPGITCGKAKGCISSCHPRCTGLPVDSGLSSFNWFGWIPREPDPPLVGGVALCFPYVVYRCPGGCGEFEFCPQSEACPDSDVRSVNVMSIPLSLSPAPCLRPFRCDAVGGKYLEACSAVTIAGFPSHWL